MEDIELQPDQVFKFYILPNMHDEKDDPKKYALQLDNPYKMGFFAYEYNIDYVIKLQFHGQVGGSQDLYKSIPKLTGTPAVLIGDGYLTLWAELEGEGQIYACAVLKTDEMDKTPPKSRQIFRGLDGLNNPCVATGYKDVKLDSFF